MVEGLAGNSTAHAALLRALLPALRSYFGRRLGSLCEEVEDLVQETLISIHERRISYDPARPFTPWLYAIARYRLIDHVRRRRMTLPIEDAEPFLEGEGFEDATAAKIDVEALLSTLTPKQAMAIRRTRLEGLSTAEAAAAAGIGESDVKISVHRGLKSLAGRLRTVSR